MVTNSELFDRAQRVIPGGVNSPVRSFGSVGGNPYFVKRAEGAYVWDVEDRRYLDYVQSWGASIVGHAHPHVIQEINEAAKVGTSYGAPTEREVLLAEAVRARVSGCDQLRLVSSGTEATMSAVRLARAFTNRARVIKFAGNYHGHSDLLLASAGSGVLATPDAGETGVPASAGVPPNAVTDTVVVPYNKVPNVQDDVACVIVEPVAANMGLVPPVPGFLEGLRRACKDAGSLLIFDEVITGFRVGRSGASGTTGVVPDLWCFGKVIGGGLPLAGFGGREDVMRLLAPLGPVYQAGTLSGNPLATAAGLAVLDLLDDAAYEMLTGRAEELAKQLAKAANDAGLEVQVPTYGPLVGLFFGAEPVTDYEGAKRSAEMGLYPRFFHATLQRGIALPPSPYEVFFPSLAHSWNDIERSGDVFAVAAANLSAAC